MTINKQLIEFCITAYGCLKDDPSDKACWIEYRQNSERHITYIMQKHSWYYGAWAVFDGSTFVANIDESLLKEWHQAKYPK